MGDLLMSHDGEDVTYDTIGNPNSLNGRNYVWEHGWELRQVTYANTEWTNTYDVNGLRAKREGGGKTYSYTYNGSQLSRMTVGDDTLTFFYDAAGTPLSVIHNGTTYYYATNLQGDVVALLNDSGADVVTYTYDAWGKLLTTGGSMANTLGALNPIRYRGYVYDTETGLYYLQSRYYDPEVGRFINADALSATGQGLLGNNMFAYCGNNPVMRADPSGNAYRPVGIGIQFEVTIGGVVVGVEFVIYWDVSECSNGGVTIACYLYGGLSVSTNDPNIIAALGIITDNASLITSGAAGIAELAGLLGNELSASVSVVMITGNEDFTKTESYEGAFTSIGGNLGKVTGSVAYSENCIAYSLGVTVGGTATIIPSLGGVSKTHYVQLFEVTIGSQQPSRHSNYNKHTGGQNSQWVIPIQKY